MEYIDGNNIREMVNPGVISRQLINPENSTGKRVTVTEVHLDIGACQPGHAHDSSEQNGNFMQYKL